VPRILALRADDIGISEHRNIDYEIIVIDDGSPDGTLAVGEEPVTLAFHFFLLMIFSQIVGNALQHHTIPPQG
jgi:hypothetical protein